MIPRFALRPDSTDAVVVREICQENVYRVSPGDFAKGDVVVDIGANIGAFALWAVRCGATRVVAYEPENDNYACLRGNLDLNPGLRGAVEAVLRGVWSTATTLQVVGRHGGAQTHAEAGGTVAADSLDELFEGHAIEACAFLKLDVEGAEYPIFDGAASATLDRCRRIALEFHAAPEDRLGRLLTKLTRTHKLEVLGSVDRGGYIWAERY